MSSYEKLNLILSLIALLISLFVFFKNRLYTNRSFLIEIFNQMSASFSNYQLSRHELAVSQKSDATFSSISLKHHENLLTVLSVYDHACYWYYHHAFSRKVFREHAALDIKSLFLTPDFSDVLNSSSQFDSLKKFYQNVC